jgi:nitric oxide reductase activation protein
VFTRRVRNERSLATLLLADLSLSTDAYASNTARVIDVIRDALYVFGEALSASDDPFEMLGFTSVRRQNVRIQHLKGFDEPWRGACARPCRRHQARLLHADGGGHPSRHAASAGSGRSASACC